MSPRLALPARRHHLTQKVKIAGQRTLYIIVPDDEYPTELFLRQNVDPLIKSPIEALPWDAQHDESSTQGEDS
jgi:hypothetical protein